MNNEMNDEKEDTKEKKTEKLNNLDLNKNEEKENITTLNVANYINHIKTNGIENKDFNLSSETNCNDLQKVNNSKNYKNVENSI